MTKKIALMTVLGAAVISYISAEFNDAPGTNDYRHAMSTNAPVSDRAAKHSTPQASAEIIDHSATEVVLGLRVQKDRNCKVELKDYVTPDGEMFAAYSCTPHKPAQPHRYAGYDDEALASMAYSDAEAAALLGRRLIDKDTHRSYELLIRASALDGGNTEPLAWLSDQAFGVTEINGEPQVANLQRRYELAALAARLGDDPGNSHYLRGELLRLGINEARLARLDTRADVLLQSMRDIQRIVLGEVTIGGHGDV